MTAIKCAPQSIDATIPTTELTASPPMRSLAKLLRALFHPLLLLDAYTFRWLTFDPQDVDNNQQQAFTKVTNVGLISALMLTVFAGWVQAVATTSYASYGDYAPLAQGVSCVAICTGVVLLVMSVINSVLLLLAVNDAENDRHATILLQKLGLWFILPALYFYLGVLVATVGVFVWVPAVFPSVPAALVLVAGLFLAVGVNPGYYQFIVLSVYEARRECGMNVPGPPAWMARFTSCGRSPPKAHAPLSKDSGRHDGESRLEAARILEQSFERVGHGDLVARAKEAEWDHLSALRDMEERHALALDLPPGAAVRFIASVRRQVELLKQQRKVE